MAVEKLDSVTGTATTGHEWDGIRELNTPLPRWWLWLFYMCIVWGIGYVIAYPAWPMVSSYTKGVLGYASRDQIEVDLAALRNQRSGLVSQIEATPLADIEKNPQLLTATLQIGKQAFGTNCSPCHGTGGAGSVGFPNLNDDQWLWGGTLDQIQQTITHGIRNESPDSRQGNMLAFGKDGTLSKTDIPIVAAYVVSLSGRKPEGAHDLAKGKQIFAENCAVCHGDDGKGNPELGAPNLTSGLYLYGGDQKTIEETITNGRGGVMPVWTGRLDPTTIKILTVYVHSLGGGK
ncbi:cytochrome-c oxidase, cbb3-type subunit III [Alsobacter sp. SYSU M60028]|uniref:Cbb3-type cytochrome c oxidase subunit n=1 Tax=Alsobacter ponti TaxID=2962936 RepID=A0ABT1L6P5_9HYPH|nr:cytochrome-c oxidase, cbb3-type subunit III [Alsobacter ponti]MCP8936984.1 cytochrome-c oxidase, cbb3-type subunit III [Alsobacter ponti]